MQNLIYDTDKQLQQYKQEGDNYSIQSLDFQGGLTTSPPKVKYGRANTCKNVWLWLPINALITNKLYYDKRSMESNWPLLDPCGKILGDQEKGDTLTWIHLFTRCAV